MTDYEVGTRVRALAGSFYSGQEGVVMQRGGYPNYLSIIFDNLLHQGLHCVSPLDLEVIGEPAKADAKPERYVTAFVLDNDEFTLTSCHGFKTKEAADHYAKSVVQENDGDSIAVFKMVSKHSSAVTVTSEDV